MCRHIVKVNYLGPTTYRGARLSARELNVRLTDPQGRRRWMTIARDWELDPAAQALGLAADVADRNCDRRPHAATFHFYAEGPEFVIVEGAH
jgi:hypothetical protein